MNSRELELANDFNKSWIRFGSNILKYVNEYGFSDVSSLVSLIRNLDGRYLTLVPEVLIQGK